jgi:hypothetical protein
MITQAKFINATKENVECILNGTPVIGHAKAMAHYVMGNPKAGNKAIKAASRTVGVLTGATLGMAAGGPAGAFGGGIVGGIYVDGITTQVESAITSEYRPNGAYYLYDRLNKKEATTSEVFDAVAGFTLDGVAGYTQGKAISYRAKSVAAKESASAAKVSISGAGSKAAPSQRAKRLGEKSSFIR